MVSNFDAVSKSQGAFASQHPLNISFRTYDVDLEVGGVPLKSHVMLPPDTIGYNSKTHRHSIEIHQWTKLHDGQEGDRYRNLDQIFVKMRQT